MLLDYFLAVIIASLRWGAICLALPMIGGRSFPMQARLILVLLSGLVFYPYALTAMKIIPSSTGIIYLCIKEIMLGASLALIVAMGFSVTTIAGDILSMVSGLSFAQIIDPSGQESMTSFTKMFSLLGFAIFLQTESLEALLYLVGKSYETFAIGQLLHFHAFGLIAKTWGIFLTQASLLALPFVAILLLGNLALGYLSRTVPQINLIVVGLPGGILLLLILFLFFFNFLKVEIAGHHIIWLDKFSSLTEAINK